MKKTINRDQIKYIAIVLMLIDHIIQVFPICNKYVYDALDGLSHFTFVAMAYFMVEGFYYTHSRKKYALRLLIFGLVSQLPYMLAFSEGKTLSFVGLNIGFSLLAGFLMIWKLDTGKSTLLNILTVIIIFMFSIICDWFFMGQLVILIFYLNLSKTHTADEQKKKSRSVRLPFYIICFIIGSYKAWSYVFQSQLFYAIYLFFVSILGVAILGFIINRLYNNQKMETHLAFNKWFFYVFYPLHLTVIGLIRMIFH